MTATRRLAGGLFALVLLGGCTEMTVDQFARGEPALELERYFAGQTKAWGLFEDRFGAVRRQFAVDISGTWDGAELVLDEAFTYKDGESDRRVWRLRKTGPTTWEGRADDVVGVASGEVAGNAFNWRYDLMLKVGEGRWQVHFDDWMFLQDESTLINRARVSKWGIEIGQVTLFFRKGS